MEKAGREVGVVTLFFIALADDFFFEVYEGGCRDISNGNVRQVSLFTFRIKFSGESRNPPSAFVHL